MKQITTIEDLQDAIALNKEIYNVSYYEINTGKLVFSKQFSIWIYNDQVMEKTWTNDIYRPNKDYMNRSKLLHEWIKGKSLFWTDPIHLELSEHNRHSLKFNERCNVIL